MQADFDLAPGYATGRIEQLSGGQRSRVVLASALWNKPHFIILDEPTNFLDRESLGALVRAIQKFRGGIVIVSHNEEFVTSISSQLWRTGGGKVVVEKVCVVRGAG